MATEALEDDFCDVISKALRGAGRTVPELAAHLAVPDATAHAWCKGSVIPEPDYVERIAAFLALRPQQLHAIAEGRYHPNIPVPNNVERYIQHPQPSNGYLIRSGDEVAAVDPAGDGPELIRRILATGAHLAYLLVTHRHDDHCDAVTAVLAAFPTARALMPQLEAVASELTACTTPPTTDGPFPFGNTTITATFVPGHTDGLHTYQIDNMLFVGDALFAGSIGRNFGPLTPYATQREMLRERILTRDPDVTILPGHGPPTTVALERANNPFL